MKSIFFVVSFNIGWLKYVFPSSYSYSTATTSSAAAWAALAALAAGASISLYGCHKKRFTSKPPFQQLQAELKFLLESFAVVLFEKNYETIYKIILSPFHTCRWSAHQIFRSLDPKIAIKSHFLPSLFLIIW